MRSILGCAASIFFAAYAPFVYAQVSCDPRETSYSQCLNLKILDLERQTQLLFDRMQALKLELDSAQSENMRLDDIILELGIQIRPINRPPFSTQACDAKEVNMFRCGGAGNGWQFGPAHCSGHQIDMACLGLLFN